MWNMSDSFLTDPHDCFIIINNANEWSFDDVQWWLQNVYNILEWHQSVRVIVNCYNNLIYLIIPFIDATNLHNHIKMI